MPAKAPSATVSKFNTFLVTRACSTSTAPWFIYEYRLHTQELMTEAEALAITQSGDHSTSKTLALVAIPPLI